MKNSAPSTTYSSKRKVIDSLIELHEHGIPLIRSSILSYNPQLYDAFYNGTRVFPSLFVAREAAAQKLESKGDYTSAAAIRRFNNPGKLSEKEVAEKLSELKNSCLEDLLNHLNAGNALDERSMESNAPGLVKRLNLLFGRYYNALAAATYILKQEGKEAESKRLGFILYQGSLPLIPYFIKKLGIDFGKLWYKGITNDLVFMAGEDAITRAINQFNPNKGQFSALLNVSIPRAIQREINLKKRLSQVSLNIPIGDGNRELADFIENNAAQTPYEQLVQNELREIIGSMLVRLTPRERKILTMRFGLDGCPSKSFYSQARETGVSREGIRQAVVASLKKLRCFPQTRKLEAYLS